MRSNSHLIVRYIFPILISFFFGSPLWAAEEVFLLLNYAHNARLLRIKTDDESGRPIGYTRDCRPSDEFFIDNLRNIRLYYARPGTEKFKAPGHIYRQVFDGLVNHADMGVVSPQIDDQRGLIDESFVAAPVYRPYGAPFSTGCGVGALASDATGALVEGEADGVRGLNWYVIPNGSWYQSWHKTNNGKSFKIYYDNWQYKINQIIESYDIRPGVSFDRIAGVVEDRYLYRLAVSGAMEYLGAESSPAIYLHQPGGYSVFHHRPAVLDHGDLFFYSWWGKFPGSLLKNGDPTELELKAESSDADRRFIGVLATGLKSYVAYVVGTDILRSWLAEHDMIKDSKEAECSLAAFSRNDIDGKLYLYAFSAPNLTIYRFLLGSGQRQAPDIIRAEQNIEAMTVDRSGNLYYSIQVAMPRKPDFDGFMTQGFARLEFKISSGSEHYYETLPISEGTKFDRLEGRMIFFQRFFQQVYLIGFNSYFPQYISEVALANRYFSSDFILNNINMTEIPVDYRDFMELAAKSPNQLNDLKEHEDKPEIGSGIPRSVRLADF